MADPACCNQSLLEALSVCPFQCNKHSFPFPAVLPCTLKAIQKVCHCPMSHSQAAPSQNSASFIPSSNKAAKEGADPRQGCYPQHASMLILEHSPHTSSRSVHPNTDHHGERSSSVTTSGTRRWLLAQTAVSALGWPTHAALAVSESSTPPGCPQNSFSFLHALCCCTETNL